MSVTAHPPRRRAESAWVWTRPSVGDRPAPARTVGLGPGRIAQRPRTTREALGGSSDGPGLGQGLARGRPVLFPKSGQERVAVVEGVTSLRPERAPPERVLAVVRGQWQRAHTSHGVRDVPCDADRSQGRCGTMPHVIAAFRTPVMGLRRGAGPPNLAAACRRLAAQPLQALARIGIALEN